VEEILGSLRETTSSNADLGRSDNRGTRLASTSDNPSTSKILEVHDFDDSIDDHFVYSW